MYKKENKEKSKTRVWDMKMMMIISWDDVDDSGYGKMILICIIIMIIIMIITILYKER